MADLFVGLGPQHVGHEVVEPLARLFLDPRVVVLVEIAAHHAHPVIGHDGDDIELRVVERGEPGGHAQHVVVAVRVADIDGAENGTGHAVAPSLVCGSRLNRARCNSATRASSRKAGMNRSSCGHWSTGALADVTVTGWSP